ncbi:hypothetical protein NMY22_g11689 [Coprinellus aureogranulatus]|nr:hypothetical protein NMY22_g11689 [Coprinellus aureogranulatus]
MSSAVPVAAGVERLVLLLIRRADNPATSTQLSNESSLADSREEDIKYPASRSALKIVTSLAELLSGSLSESQAREHDSATEMHAAETLLQFAIRSNDPNTFSSESDSVKHLQVSIQDGLQKTVTGLVDTLCARVPDREEPTAILDFLQEISKTPPFCPSVESVGHRISNRVKEVLKLIRRTSNPDEHDSRRMGVWIDFLVRCSGCPWINFQRVISPEDLHQLYFGLSRHGFQGSAINLLFNLSEDAAYDGVTSLYPLEILGLTLQMQDPGVEMLAPDAMSQRNLAQAARRARPLHDAPLLAPPPVDTPRTRGRSIARSSKQRDSDQGPSLYSVNRIMLNPSHSSNGMYIGQKASANRSHEQATSDTAHRRPSIPPVPTPEPNSEELNKLGYQAIHSVYHGFIGTQAVARLGRHREVLQIRLWNTNIFVIVVSSLSSLTQGNALKLLQTSLFAVAQVIFSTLLFSRKFSDEPGRQVRVEVTWTAAIILAFSSVFLSLLISVSAFSFAQAICRALETGQRVSYMKQQAHDWLASLEGVKSGLEDNWPINAHCVQVFCQRLQRGGSEARRLDHLVLDHIHDGSRYTFLLFLDLILFLASILLSAITTKSLAIWLPISICLGLALFHFIVQELKHRPGKFKAAMNHLTSPRGDQDYSHKEDLPETRTVV